VSVVSRLQGDVGIGTLVWVGDASVPEFESAFRDCVELAAQVALRRDLEELIRRPAHQVCRIVLARATREPVDEQLLSSMASQYRDATLLELVGPSCEGDRYHLPVESTRVAWHRWNQVFPSWLGGSAGYRDSGGYSDSDGNDACLRQIARSVAVITSCYSAAQTYLDLAESVSVTACWCDGPDSARVRNFDAVWWDDSVVGPADVATWRQRVARFASTVRLVRHAWITHGGRLDQRRAALDAGIESVISKPYRIEALLEMIEAKPNAEMSKRAAA
jgi:hypothetical protein